MTVHEWLGEDNEIGIDIWKRKYQYNNESFDEWLDRVSGGNSAIRNRIVKKQFLFGGRILANRGLENEGRKITLSNCYVMNPVEDNIESIFNCARDLARTYSYGGGCGVDISNLAPCGAAVRNAAKETSGAVSFMDLFSLVTELIGQNGRRGALMISMDVHHPDIEKFIDIKTDLSKVTKANISIKVDADFMNAVKNNSDYELRFYREETNQYITKIVNARKLFHHIAEVNWDYGEPGMLFWDRVNSWNMLSNRADFQYAGVNPCITGDTLVFTGDGRYIVPIGQLYDEFTKNPENFNVPVLTWDDKLQRNKFQKINWVQYSGVKPVYKVRLDDGSCVKATKDHLFMLSDGRKLPLSELHVGDCLMPFRAKCYEEYQGCRNMLVNLNNGKSKNYYHLQAEYYFGSNIDDFGRSRTSLNMHHKDNNHINNDPTNLEVVTQSLHSSRHISGSNNPMVKWFNETTEENREAYRAKMRARNSGVNNPNYGKKASKEKLAKLSAATKRFMQDPAVKARQKQGQLRGLAAQIKSILLKILDSNMEINEQNYMVCKNELSRTYPTYTKAHEVGRRFGYDNVDDFFNYLLTDFNHRIVSIEYVGDEPVYDMNVVNNHNFAIATSVEYTDGVDSFTGSLSDIHILNGIIIGNCGEETLPAGGSCLLGSINLAAFVHNSKFDFKELSECVYDAVDALNDVLDEGQMLHPLEYQRQSARDWRQIGLGIMGLADCLIAMGLTYGSKKSLQFCEMLSHHIAASAVGESCKLAEKFGPYPNYSDLMVHTDFFQNLDKNSSLSLYNNVCKYGLRNSQILTIAPTGTISTMLGISGGIEPIFANSYTRKTESLFGEDKYYKVYTPIVKKYMALYRLADESELPSWFVTSKDISIEDRINMQAVWQKHIDASISSTINLPHTATVEDIENVYMLAYDKGLKGVTVFRDKCKRVGILSNDQNTTSSAENQSGPISLARGEVIKVNDHVIGKKRKLMTGCGTLHCVALFDPEDGQLLETYLSKGSTGGCNNFMVGLSRMISVAARGGIPIDVIIDQLDSTGSCPSYAVRRAIHKDTSKGSCCPMAVGNALKDMYEETQNDLAAKNYVSSHFDNKLQKALEISDSEFKCPECGEPLAFEGGCNICKNCGWSRCS